MADDERPSEGPESDSRLEGEGSVKTATTSNEARPPTPGVEVDPRMRSRRIAVRRGQGRRRLKRVTLVLGVLALGVAAAAAAQSPLLDVDQVTVTGIAHTPERAVRRAAGIHTGDVLVAVDLGAVADRVEELPWVDRARVTRDWPSTVRIQVTERTVAAIVQVTEDRAALVDSRGRVLSSEPWASDSEPGAGDAPLVLTGIEGRVTEGEQLSGDAQDALELATALRDRLPGVVASVSTDLDAALVEGGSIRFGSTDQLEAKVTAAMAVLSDVDMTCLETLDVRVPGSPALTRDRRCS
jgi:cell division protein FtsQ